VANDPQAVVDVDAGRTRPPTGSFDQGVILPRKAVRGSEVVVVNPPDKLADRACEADVSGCGQPNGFVVANDPEAMASGEAVEQRRRFICRTLVDDDHLVGDAVVSRVSG